MISTYDIQGMTCNGCRKKVEEALNHIDGVTNVSVDLEKAEARIDMKNKIDIRVFQESLSDKYHIEEKSKKPLFSAPQVDDNKEKSTLRQLYPLFLIFGYITVASILLNKSPWSTEGFMLDFMGLFYIVFGFFKMLDLKGFPESFAMYDPLAKRLMFYGWVYPFIETLLGIQFLMRFEIKTGLIVTLVILGITTIGVTRILLDKKTIQCACLGTALKLPMTKATFIENTIMLSMAVWMLIKLY